MSEITPWDGRPLDAAIIGLAWPGPDDPAGAFSAAGGGRVVLVPDDRRGDFFDAHPQAGFAADLIAVPRPFAAAVDPIIAAGRLYDVELFKSLVETAIPNSGQRLVVPGVPAGWGGWSEERRRRADALRTHADRMIQRVGVDPTLVARFGPLGLGIEVRAAAAARAVGAELKVLDGRLPGLRAAVERRRATASKAFERFPAVKSLVNQSGGANFLRTGRPGAVDAAALAALVRALRGQLRRRDALPVATPVDPTDLYAWELLAGHHPVLAAWVELSAAVELADSLEAGGVVRTRVLTFPELRTTGPDLGYLRRLAGPGALAPAEPGRKLLIADIPGLELRCLAACLGRTFYDFALTRLIDTSGTEGVRHELARRVSGLGEDEYLRLAARTDPAVAEFTSLADAALKYFPRGVTDRDLEAWLTEFESGVRPTARQVAAAWRAIVEFAPSLPRYCSADGAALVSANLGATAAELRAAVAGRRGGGGDGCDLSTLVGVLATGTASAGATAAQAVAFFTSPDGFPNSTLPANLQSAPGALAGALLASDHATPTGRVYLAATPVQVVGTDHTGLADAVRKEVLTALVASGLDMAGFAGDEFAAVVPADGPARRDAVRNLVLAAVVGVLPDFRGGVFVREMDAW